MLLRRRIGLLLMGSLGSIAAAVLLIHNCVFALSVPVVAEMKISFPYKIENTPLIIQTLTGYEGAFVEDGSDEEVVDVAALLLYNAGDSMIENAKLTVQCEGSTLDFVLSYLPADTACIVLERNARMWHSQNLYACSAQYDLAEPEEKQQPIYLQQNDGRYLRIQNLTQKPIHNVKLYHKTWSKELGCFLGGIAYETAIDTLWPEQILLMSPKHYVSGGSQIVAITCG